jgi:hypothetical protein
VCATDRCVALICSALIIQKYTDLSLSLFCFVLLLHDMFGPLLIRPTRLICGFHSRPAVFAFSPPPKIDAHIDWDDPRAPSAQRWAKDKCSFWVFYYHRRSSFFGASAKNWTNLQRRFNCHLPQLCSFLVDNKIFGWSNRQTDAKTSMTINQ